MGAEMTDCPQCVRLRNMTPEEVVRFYAPLMKSQHWELVAQPERLREIAIQKHTATHRS